MGDFGANLGYVISSGGFQKGAREAAEFTNIKLVNWEEFEVEWMERWTDTYLRPRMYAAADILFMYVDPWISKKLGAMLDAVSAEKRKEFFDTRHTPEIELPYSIGTDVGGPMNKLVGDDEPLQLPYKFNNPSDTKYAPTGIVTTESLREFGEMVQAWAVESKRRLDEILTP
jgi:hypothetical protein